MQQSRTLSSGFTLIELLVTLALAAIVVSQAAPSFSSMVKSNRLAIETNTLVSDINLARSEAIKRGTRVILCRSADPAAATPSCGGSANTWTSGWLVFASGDANNIYDSATDTLIRIGKPRGGQVQIKTNNTSDNNLEYDPDGTTNEGGSTAIFAICDDQGESQGRQIQVNGTGRPRLLKGTPPTPLPNFASPVTA
ncbi:MAG TPA: prepilin-type N-terminal cleavage/methylation domain-containing protein [Chromatiales bacterium]|nr:prepilin-type N-terminal cleavage/methylation domain-containing protein [Chromatiales bacterium]HEX23255.1 prepilin-type N-terminal cleavage/methylation domain-containing protein [Chromatiales bacterium]